MGPRPRPLTTPTVTTHLLSLRVRGARANHGARGAGLVDARGETDARHRRDDVAQLRAHRVLIDRRLAHNGPVASRRAAHEYQRGAVHPVNALEPAVVGGELVELELAVVLGVRTADRLPGLEVHDAD